MGTSSTAASRGRTLVLLALGAAATPAARAQDAPPAAPPAVPPPAAAPAAVPLPETPRPTEFLASDIVRRPDGTIVHYYRVNYVSPEVLARELEPWKSPKAQIGPTGVTYAAAPVATGAPKTAAIGNIANVLRIIETEENWPVLERVLRIVDVPQPQVRVEAKVMELTWGDDLRVGVTSKISKPLGDTFFNSADINFPNTLDAVNGSTIRFREVEKYLIFDYALQLAEQGAKAEVISQPSILASQGETAVIKAGDLEPYIQQNISGNTVTTSTSFKDVGIKLEVQPLLIGRDAVRVRILAEASRVSDFRVTATSPTQQVINAVISSRNADTVVTVPNGETLVIGGLEQQTERDDSTGIPFLKDIPVLGYLFGSTTKRSQKTELFFWITLTIERPEEARLFLPPGERSRIEDAARAASAPGE